MPDDLEEFDEFSELTGEELSEASVDPMSMDEFSELPPDSGSEAGLEAPPAVPADSTAEAEPAAKPKREPGRFAKAFNVYNGMLLVAFCALTIGTLLLALELARYGFSVRPPQR